jgi:surface polysaccharide O-acyltransferase-like enzyme
MHHHSGFNLRAAAIQNNITSEQKSGGFPLPVDLIRVVAIILVLMYHAANEPYSQLNMTSTQYFVFWWSTTFFLSIVVLGVPLFIMLSGALLLQPQKANEPIRFFLKKRLSRIGVAFAFWSVIYFAWSYFVDHTALTANSILQSLLDGGAYKQFWFIYLIMGLYLITPILRVVTANADRKILRYLIILWFIGVALVPLFHLFSGFQVDSNLFAFGGFIGYFVLGTYLIGLQMQTKTVKRLLVLGIISTIAATYLMNFVFQSMGEYYFFTYVTSATVIVSAAALFMLLSKRHPDWPKNSHPKIQQLVGAISANTLPIFFLHVIVIEALNQGLLGFRISLLDITPAVEIPLLTVVTLFLTLGLVMLFKKVAVLKTLIG